MAAREFDTSKVTLRRKLGESHQEPASSWPNYPVYGNFPDLSSSTRFVGPLNKHCKNFCERLNRCGALPSGRIGPRPPPVCQVYLIRDFVVEGDHLSPK